MAKSKKEMEIELVKAEGMPDNTGVFIEGEFCRPGDKLTVPLAVGRNLIHRGRAVKASEKASGKASGKGK